MCWTFQFLFKPAINALCVEQTHTSQTRYGLALLHVHKAYYALSVQVLIQYVINPINSFISISISIIIVVVL